jgi:hypothetical protein
MTRLEIIRAAIVDEFHEIMADTREDMVALVERDVVDPLDDPGQWAPESFAIVRHERGILQGWDGLTYDIAERWAQLDLGTGPGGGPLYIEAINGAVSAIWEA